VALRLPSVRLAAIDQAKTPKQNSPKRESPSQWTRNVPFDFPIHRDLARQRYLGFGETPDRWGALYVKSIGFFPPGSYVRLLNVEWGVVVRRGEMANAPKVMALTGRLGTPLGEPVLRDTAEAACAVQASLPPGEVKVVVNVERLIARC